MKTDVRCHVICVYFICDYLRNLKELCRPRVYISHHGLSGRGARSLKLRDFERRVRLVSHHPPWDTLASHHPPWDILAGHRSVQRGLEQPKLNFYTKILILGKPPFYRFAAQFLFNQILYIIDKPVPTGWSFCIIIMILVPRYSSTRVLEYSSTRYGYR
jgi:hypothetical protein